MPIVELLPPGLSVSPAAAYALLELAYLVTAVDGRLTDEELRAFKELTARLRGKDVARDAEVDALIARFAGYVETHEIEARVRELAPKLPKEHHELAYLLALGLAFADHDPHAAEDRLHAVLGDALDVPAARRAELSRQVALGGGRAG
jgi:uncharacterized tellurite resistance protein B-like protein